MATKYICDICGCEILLEDEADAKVYIVRGAQEKPEAHSPESAHDVHISCLPEKIRIKAG